jgi:RAT1-interacting protein
MDEKAVEGEVANGTHNRSGKRELSITPPTQDSLKVARKEGLTLPIKAASQYTTNRQPTLFQQPVQITSFSYDEARRLHHDDRSRSYYHPPPPRADLNRGFEELIERDETVNEHLDSLLISLMKLSEKGNADQLQKANLVTWRGMMTKLCTLLYEDRQGFEMNAMMVGDTLYLEEHKDSSHRLKKAEEDPKLKLFGYYGYSFESWTCHKAQHPVDPWDGNVNTNIQWCSIVKTKLGDTRCILAGEVDAVDVKTHSPIEVKTSMQIRNQRDEERFESKMLRFYMQSFLLGIAMVVVGFRDFKGYIVTHQEFPTLTMPRLVRGKAHAWDPVACLNLADELITSIQAHIAASLPSSPPALSEAIETYPVHRLIFDIAAKTVSVQPLEEETILEQIKEGQKEKRVGFLLSEYYEMAIKGL